MNLTQQDISRAVGVSPATVSRALRNDPRVSEETRGKIMKIVREAGYRQSPFVNAWSLHARKTQSKRELTFAHVTGISENRTKNETGAETLSRILRERMTQLGGSIDTFNLAGEMTPKRLNGILYTRAVSGILLGPFPPDADPLPLDYAAFPVVGIGQARAVDPMHRVIHSRYLTLRRALASLAQSGYRKPGLVGFGPPGSPAARGWLPAFLHYTSRSRRRIPPWLPIQQMDECALRQWLRKHTPDVVLSPFREMYPFLDSYGRKETAFFQLNMSENDNDGSLAGVLHPTAVIASAAFDLLLAQCDFHEKGLPKHPRKISYPGRIVLGRSCPALNEYAQEASP